jgi:hypothetical protein
MIMARNRRYLPETGHDHGACQRTPAGRGGFMIMGSCDRITTETAHDHGERKRPRALGRVFLGDQPLPHLRTEYEGVPRRIRGPTAIVKWQPL